ncbi:unnamed protein product [Triticum turgidum subsp. durum]|uniref:Uncharacterized protein n=1 Tax=Triticum turgidum subsp. durum TaxID=4567 RepID=A0A9R0YR52_TRITD|nr:unnamed protein product [Triticum turgidum subsp. durum]
MRPVQRGNHVVPRFTAVPWSRSPTAALLIMGAGGRMTEKEREKQEQLGRANGGAAYQRSPTDKPPFTLGQIKKAIPPHCFQRSIIKSFSYVVHDLVIVAALLYAALVWIPTLPTVLQLGAWPLYWIVQGCVMTGVWVIAHECGHHAFSDYSLLDDTVGLVLHSWLLVPYFSWKYSHRRHHSNTGSLERDEVFVPKQKEALAWYTPYIYNNPVGRLHTHPALPHYDSTEWDWLRGALATMDRDYGILNRVFHNITDTHVAHHLFSTMPHYHAMEATKAIKPILGEYYQFDPTPVAKATWREAKECIYVEPEDRKGVFWYSNKF